MWNIRSRRNRRNKVACINNELKSGNKVINKTKMVMVKPKYIETINCTFA
jgi:hypothetical protein